MVKEVAVTKAPDGIPKAGRVWKARQKTRSSLQLKSDILNVNKSFEQKEAIRVQRKRMLDLERSMKEEKKAKKIEEKTRREEQEKRRLANEYKNSVYQTV